MTAVATALSTSLDGFIAGADDSPEQPLGVGGQRLFKWFSDGDTPSRYYPSFKMSAVSAEFFDEGVGRVGAGRSRPRERRVGPRAGGGRPGRHPPDVSSREVADGINRRPTACA